MITDHVPAVRLPLDHTCDLVAAASRREDAGKTAEILILRHQFAVQQRRQPRRPNLNWADRAMLATLLSVIPKARRHGLRLLVTPDTILRWHRSIIRRRWAARSMRGKTGRPATRQNIKALVLRLAGENPEWGTAGSTANWLAGSEGSGVDRVRDPEERRDRSRATHRAAPPTQPACGHARRQHRQAGRSQQGTTGLTRCADGKSHPPKALRTGTGASVQGSGERNVLPGQSASSPSWRAASADRASSPRLMPEPAPGWTGSSCCCAAVFCCCTRASNAGSGFRNYLFELGGAKGIRTPDLLHAMQLRRPACQGISGFYLRN
jgi:hypothetical protein